MSNIPLDDLANFIQLRHGKIADCQAPLYAIMRDERFLLPAFFDHYRSLGVDQFVILDDGSEDGTLEYLCAQPDCAVLSSEKGFGEWLNVAYPDGHTALRRWGPCAKYLIPRKFLSGKTALYVDADEFLILPEGRSLPELMRCMETRNIDCIAANLVEFFPASVHELSGDAAPATFSELIELYPYLDPEPLVGFSEDGQLRRIAGSASTRLFQTYDVGAPNWLDRLKTRMGLRVPEKKLKSAVHKTPLVRWTDGVWLVGSHNANVPPTPDALLTFAHFRFTHDFVGKVTRAMQWKSHSRSGAKYFTYENLVHRMKRGSGSFLGPASVRYEGPDQLERAGLLRWDLAC